MKLQEALKGEGSRSLVSVAVMLGLLAVGYVWFRPMLELALAGAYLPLLGGQVGLLIDRLWFHWARPSANHDDPEWQKRRVMHAGVYVLAFTLLGK